MGLFPLEPPFTGLSDSRLFRYGPLLLPKKSTRCNGRRLNKVTTTLHVTCKCNCFRRAQPLKAVARLFDNNHQSVMKHFLASKLDYLIYYLCNQKEPFNLLHNFPWLPFSLTTRVTPERDRKLDSRPFPKTKNSNRKKPKHCDAENIRHCLCMEKKCPWSSAGELRALWYCLYQRRAKSKTICLGLWYIFLGQKWDKLVIEN